MVVKVSVQYNGGLLLDVILSTLCDCIGDPFNNVTKSVIPYSQF